MSEDTEGDPQTVEFLLSVLSSAAHNFKWNSLINPFPNELISTGEEEKDISRLRELIESFPKICGLSWREDLTSEQCKLADWLLERRKYSLKSRIVKDFNQMFSKSKTAEDFKREFNNLTSDSMTRLSDKNILVYEICYNQEAEASFQRKRGERETIMAFHGTEACNFHSILRHGLLNHMNTRALFGEGIYFSKTLTTASTFSSASFIRWRNNPIGESQRIVCMCEIINDPKTVIQVQPEDSGEPRRHAKSMPDDYIIVRNNDLVRVKYLIVYPVRKSQTRVVTRHHRLMVWFREHQNTFWILFYILILILAGLISNKRVRLRIQKMYESATDLFGISDYTHLDT